jgi:hypothetical protein
MKTKTFSVAILTTLILALSVQTAFALLGVWENRCSSAKVQGNSYGCGGKRVSKPSSSVWLAEISSYTSPSLSIPVGWTYWTARGRCNGSINQQDVNSGRSVTAVSTYDYQYMTVLSCTGTRAGQVLGRHEVKGNLFIWLYDWTKSDTIP